MHNCILKKILNDFQIEFLTFFFFFAVRMMLILPDEYCSHVIYGFLYIQ